MNKTKSLVKAFEVLELFLEVERDDLRLADIAKLSGLKMSTANRIAATLVDLGYLSQSGKRGKYSIGKKLTFFDSILSKKNTFKDLVRPYLIKLNESTGETVVLVNFDGKRVFFVENIISKHALNIRPDWSTTTPLYCTGVGKIFLADMTEPELEAYFKNTDIKSYTPNTITDLNLLKRHLMMVAQEGVAYDDEEFLPGVRNIASGVKDNEGKTFCCIGILGPTVRLTRAKMIDITVDLKRYTSEISKEIGFKNS